MSAAWSPTAAKGSSTFRGFGTRSTTAYRSSPSSAGASFLLSRKAGLKNREIAEQLNISVKAVEKHIGMALSKLRLRLSRSGFFSLFL